MCNCCINIQNNVYLCTQIGFKIVFRMAEMKEFVYGYVAAAKILQVSPNTVANYVRQGKLEGCYNWLSARKIAFSREKLEQKVLGNIC